MRSRATRALDGLELDPDVGLLDVDTPIRRRPPPARPR